MEVIITILVLLFIATSFCLFMVLKSNKTNTDVSYSIPIWYNIELSISCSKTERDTFLFDISVIQIR